MEAAPPSYQAATSNDVWLLVAPYLTSDQLCQAALVSRRWHSIFAAQLWGRPTSHFGLEYNGVLDHLARFQKALDLACLDTRSSTFCLHLTPSEAVYFDDRPKDWLKHLLERLPNLQALVVNGVPFFDHAACQALFQGHVDVRHSHKGSSSTDDFGSHIPRSIAQGDISHGLRLLDASRCDNLTTQSLAGALRRFVSLVYLDLSSTRAARGNAVLEALKDLYTLRILKLRHIQLKDVDVTLLAPAIGRRVCCLDIRDNELTAASVDSLQHYCFVDTDEAGTSVVVFSDQHMHAHVYAAYTNEAVTRLTIEDFPEGLAQLYITNNQINNIALSKLLHCPALRVLDVGRLSGLSTSPFLLSQDMLSKLGYLRIDYAAVLQLAEGDQDATRLHPRTLPHLHTLVLTGVPTHSRRDHTAAALIALIKACAVEAAHAMAQAKLDYTAPPGQQGRTSTLQRTARRIFGLTTIILEMMTTSSIVPDSRSISMTEDADSDAMWSAGASDFTFFEGEQTSPTAQPDVRKSAPLVDNLALLSAFRSGRRTAHERATFAGEDPFVEGYWPGIIRVETGNR